MSTFRFIHAADLHLDSPFIGMSGFPLVVRDVLRQSTFLALNNLVKLAIEEKVDFVLICGDVYDLADRSLRAQIRFQKAMEKLDHAEISVYIVHGNHDPEDGRAAQLHWPNRVHFFSAQMVESYVVGTGDQILARVHGISYLTSAVRENLARRFQAVGDGVFEIGMLHTNVDDVSTHANYAPCTKLDLISSGMHYWALGHVHTRQVLQLAPPLVYPGNIQGRSVRELGAKGCYLVEVSEQNQSTLHFHALDAVRWFQMSVPIEGMTTEQDLKNQLELVLDRVREDSDSRPVLIRLMLTGRGPIHSVLQKGSYLAELIAELRDEEVVCAERGKHMQNPPSFVWIASVQVETGMEIDFASLCQQKDFLGDLLRLSAPFMEDEALFERFCAEVLEPLQQQPKAGKYLADFDVQERLAILKAAQELAVDLLIGDAGVTS